MTVACLKDRCGVHGAVTPAAGGASSAFTAAAAAAVCTPPTGEEETMRGRNKRISWVVLAALAACGVAAPGVTGAAWGREDRVPLLPVMAVPGDVEPEDDDEQDDDPAFHSVDELTALSLEELMDVSIMNTEVTSVTRQRTRVGEAPAAVHVITQDDIRRSGHTSIPELLRLAPGLAIGRVNANQWAISARGFNHVFHNRYADKLLVLQDGRPLYNPLSSGIYWDAQDYLLQDLDRIEVVRGPGSTLWGANAVNGVINIVSKSARDTQGLLAHGLAGTQESIGAVRYGGRVDEETYYRVFAKYRDHYDFASLEAVGADANDGWDQFRGGFRIDRYVGDSDVFTLQGEAYEAHIGQTREDDTLVVPFTQVIEDQHSVRGADVIGRWTHLISDESDFSVQIFYDRIDRNDPTVGYEQDTFDVEVQHRFALTDRQQIVWGAGYRYMVDDVQDTEVMQVSPSSRVTYLLHAFVQDHVTLVPDRLHLFVGSKFEVNPYTGLEIQPSVRGLWTPNERNTVWAAVSRAVRTPNRLDDDATILFSRVGLPDSLVELRGGPNDDLKSEEVLAYELGYRVEPAKNLSLDVALFYNRYDELIAYVRGTPQPATPPIDFLIPYTGENAMDGKTYGAEVAAHWKLGDRWRLSGSYSFIETDVDGHGVVEPQDVQGIEEAAPAHQFQLHSYLNVTRDLELNASLYYVDKVGIHDDVGDGEVPEYTRLDVNVVWRPRKDLELTIGVQNLLDDRHLEFVPEAREQSSEIERMFYGQLVWKF